MNTKEKAYRASFKNENGGACTMDFYATSLAMAKDHAWLIASHHNLTLVRVAANAQVSTDNDGVFIQRNWH